MPTAVTMPVKGGTKCIKYLLFGFNFIFWVRRPGPRGTGMEGRGSAGSGILFAFLLRGFCCFPRLLPPRRRGVGAPVLTALFFAFFAFYRKAGRVVPGGEGLLGLWLSVPQHCVQSSP